MTNIVSDIIVCDCNKRSITIKIEMYKNTNEIVNYIINNYHLFNNFYAKPIVQGLRGIDVVYIILIKGSLNAFGAKSMQTNA